MIEIPDLRLSINWVFLYNEGSTQEWKITTVRNIRGLARQCRYSNWYLPKTKRWGQIPKQPERLALLTLNLTLLSFRLQGHKWFRIWTPLATDNITWSGDKEHHYDKKIATETHARRRRINWPLLDWMASPIARRTSGDAKTRTNASTLPEAVLLSTELL